MDKTAPLNEESQIPAFRPHITISSQSMQRTESDGLSVFGARRLTTETQKEEEAADNWFASLQMMPRSCFCKFILVLLILPSYFSR
jgi:hypothetical protein